MKYTLLDLTQKILASLDSDEINSITDTTEAQSVVAIIQTVYFDLAARELLPRDKDLFQLQPSNDPARPTIMSLPSDVAELDWVKYDTQTDDRPLVNYEFVKPLPLEDFLAMVSAFDPGETNVLTYTHPIGADTFTLYAKNDYRPRYYTTANDRTLIFDSFDNQVDTTLQNSKTMCYGRKTFPWQTTDNFVAPLDDKQHQLLLQEAKALAWAELKQAAHAKAEKSAREIRINQQHVKQKIPLQTAYSQVTGYGRRR